MSRQTTQDAWAEIGKQVNHSSKSLQMLKDAGLDWEVKKVPLFLDTKEGKRKESGKFGIIREDNEEVLTVCGPQWRPVQNSTIMNLFKDYMDKGGAKIERIGLVDSGRTVWALADIGSSFSVTKDDVVKGFVLAYSSHIVGRSTGIHLTPIRIWCANSIQRAVKGSTAGYRQNHMRDFNIDHAKEAIGLAKEEMQTFGKEAATLKKTPISDEKMLRIVADTFMDFSKLEGDKDKEKAAMDLIIADEANQSLAMRQVVYAYRTAPGADPGNAWGVLNAVTYWADHITGTKPEARLQKAWFGQNGKIKQQVKASLLQLAA